MSQSQQQIIEDTLQFNYTGWYLIPVRFHFHEDYKDSINIIVPLNIKDNSSSNPSNTHNPSSSSHILYPDNYSTWQPKIKKICIPQNSFNMINNKVSPDNEISKLRNINLLNNDNNIIDTSTGLSDGLLIKTKYSYNYPVAPFGSFQNYNWTYYDINQRFDNCPWDCYNYFSIDCNLSAPPPTDYNIAVWALIEKGPLIEKGLLIESDSCNHLVDNSKSSSRTFGDINDKRCKFEIIWDLNTHEIGIKWVDQTYFSRKNNIGSFCEDEIIFRLQIFGFLVDNKADSIANLWDGIFIYDLIPKKYNMKQWINKAIPKVIDQKESCPSRIDLTQDFRSYTNKLKIGVKNPNLNDNNYIIGSFDPLFNWSPTYEELGIIDYFCLGGSKWSTKLTSDHQFALTFLNIC